MDQLNSRSQNLDGYYASQQIVSGMGQLKQLNTMATNRIDFHGNHTIQGLGQLNSINVIHDAHYRTPEGMNGMSYISDNKLTRIVLIFKMACEMWNSPLKDPHIYLRLEPNNSIQGTFCNI
ncbi:hypothetical protein K1719_043811 [Acacia pycnantha]|nr:hypothetical protein K1719_043811 [Acacia pycnantha]